MPTRRLAGILQKKQRSLAVSCDLPGRSPGQDAIKQKFDRPEPKSVLLLASTRAFGFSIVSAYLRPVAGKGDPVGRWLDSISISSFVMDAYAMGRWLVLWDGQRGNKYPVRRIGLWIWIYLFERHPSNRVPL